MKHFVPPTSNAIVVAYEKGVEHATAFIKQFPHYQLSGDELFAFLSHYIRPQSTEAMNYLRGYLVRLQTELMQGAA